MKTPKIILSRPKLIVDVKCPKCKSFDIRAVPEIDVKCKNCSTKFKTDTPINIYSSISKKIEQLLSHHNEIIIVGERDNKKEFSAEDLLKPKSKHEDDIYHTLLAIKNTKESQRCWEVSEITNDTDMEYKVRCKDCGYCLSCVKCTCGKHYLPKIVKTKSGMEKRYSCPDCKSKGYTQTVIEKLKDGKCPYCKSKDVVNTKFSSLHKQCPKCRSIAKPKRIPIYKLIIKRQRRFWIAEDG